MRKKLAGLFLLAGLLAASAVTAHAETYYGDDNWQVTFTSGAKMESNFGAANLDEAVRGLQPGDNIFLTVHLKNEYGEGTDWYMSNAIRESLEDASSVAEGGAYSYHLKYKAPNGTEKVLYSSDTVGGDTVSQAGEGLNEATNALKDYFFLDSLEGGQSATVELEVALEGETQNNDYQDTLAALEMSFAVEVKDTSTSTRTQIVKTGDRDIPIGYIALMGAGGVILLIFAIRNQRENSRRRKGGGAQ